MRFRHFKFIVLAVAGVVLASCNMVNNTPSFQLSDLQGLWQENGTEHFVRFTNDPSDETGYLYGREWNEDDDKFEQDLLDAAEKLGHPGNGWFKYKFVVSDAGLHEIHFMDNEGADIPKFDYVVSKLTDTDLVYYEKDNKAKKTSFTKVVEK